VNPPREQIGLDGNYRHKQESYTRTEANMFPSYYMTNDIKFNTNIK
jgi:hypothetical protein